MGQLAQNMKEYAETQTDLQSKPVPIVLMRYLISDAGPVRVARPRWGPASEKLNRTRPFATSLQNRVMFAAGGFGYFATLALYSPTAFNSGPSTHSYISPMLASSRGSASMLNTFG